MNTTKIANDATASSKGTIYQLCVAVQKCYEMVAGQKVLIEQLGDVTIPGYQQVETKHYADALTDNHPNLWNTLHNWMQDTFDPEQFASLVLYTTQQFGRHARIADWNDSEATRRVTILEDIHKEAEDRESRRQSQGSGSRPKAPEVLLHQRFILESSRRSKLIDVVGKTVIEASSPTLPALHNKIKDLHIKGILEGKKSDYLFALIGFITQPDVPASQEWEITYESFDKKVGILNTLYCRETRAFPRKYFDGAASPSTKQIDAHQDYTFVQKIRDIDHHTAIPRAVRDYLGAVQTIKEEFAHYEVSVTREQAYADELIDLFESRHRVASQRCTNIVPDSQVFFEETTSEEPRVFEGFERPPMAFRNGLLHTQLDDPDKHLRWRLCK